MIYLNTPLKDEDILKLKTGDTVSITGTIYTARDAAHKRLVEDIDKGNKLPFDTKNAIIYYVGPTPAKPGEVIGSAGPTSSYRMDPFQDKMIKQGVKVTIGKGPRSDEYKKSIQEHGGVYLSAIGGTAALISKSIKNSKVIAYPDLGAEAIRELEVENFVAFVTYDSHGNDLLDEGIKEFSKRL